MASRSAVAAPRAAESWFATPGCPGAARPPSATETRTSRGRGRRRPGPAGADPGRLRPRPRDVRVSVALGGRAAPGQPGVANQDSAARGAATADRDAIVAYLDDLLDVCLLYTSD